MREHLKPYIDGRWADPAELRTIKVENHLEIKGIVDYGSRSSTA
jgi:hypothetical protein